MMIIYHCLTDTPFFHFQVKKERPVVHLTAYSESLGMPQYGKFQ